MIIFSLVAFIFFTAKAADAVSSVTEQLDLKDTKRNDILWMNLFSRINTILDETSKLSEGQIILNKRMDAVELQSTNLLESTQNFSTDLKKRLDVLDHQSTNLMENTQTYSTNLNKSLAAQDLKSTKFMETMHNHTTGLKKRLDVQDLKSSDIMENIYNYSTNLNKRLDAQELKLTEFMVNMQNHTADLKKSQEGLERKLSEFMEKAKKHFSDVKKIQEAEEPLSKHYLKRDWTTILRRQDGSVDFYRNWTEYQTGFGDPDGEFFIGLDRLYAMTSLGAQQELLVILKDFMNEERIAMYDLFRIGNEAEKYAIKELGAYSGDAGDSLDWHKGMKFTTYDEDNDLDRSGNCAKTWRGAWWFNNCFNSHLFGPYQSEERSFERGVSWYHRVKYYRSVKFAEMKIRPKNY